MTNNLLSWLAEASIVLTLAAALVLAARALARRRLAAGWIYALWFAVPAGLLATFAPAGLLLPAASPATDWFSMFTIGRLDFALAFDAPAPDPIAAAPAPTDAARPALSLPAVNPIFAVWLLGAAGLLAAHLAAQLRFMSVVVARARRPAPHELASLHAAVADARLDAERHLRFSPAVDAPIACGLVRPVVLLPDGFLADFTPEERRAMALHEAEHARAGHVLHRIAARLLRDVFWFHPLAWLAERAFAADQELACDEAALRRDASIGPRTYAATLLKAADRAAHRAAVARLPAAAVPLVSVSSFKERTMMISRHAALGRTRAAGALAFAAVASAAVLAACAVTQEPPPAPAAAPTDDAVERVFTPAIGEIVMDAQGKLGAEPPDYDGAIADFDRALGLGPTPYELGVILYMRGGAKYQKGDSDGALADWERALAEGALARQERLNLMHNAAQLKLVQEDYEGAVEGLEAWLAAGGEPNDTIHLNMVAAYMELGEQESALAHAREAFRIAEPRQKKHYDTLNYLYTEMDMPEEREALLDEMVALYPDEKNVWLSIAALHATNGDDRAAFEANAAMYENGMLISESEIMRIVNYYDHYDEPGRAADVLTREIAAGRVEDSAENREKLASLQAEAGR